MYEFYGGTLDWRYPETGGSVRTGGVSKGLGGGTKRPPRWGTLIKQGATLMLFLGAGPDYPFTTHLPFFVNRIFFLVRNNFCFFFSYLNANQILRTGNGFLGLTAGLPALPVRSQASTPVSSVLENPFAH